MIGLQAASITFTSRRIHFSCNVVPRQIVPGSGNWVGAFQVWGMNMLNKLLGAAAVAAMTMAVLPANAAKMHGVGCSGSNFEKTETAIEAMADGDAKYVAEKEIAAAQEAMLGGKMGACGQHLSKAAQASK
jgi:hypothetical protein